MAAFARLSLQHRVANALTSYVAYLGKMVWPQNLAVMYPWPADVPAWRPLAALVLLVSVSTLTVWGLRRRPYLFVGWLWFLGTLAPVIGFVQLGPQSMADRYAYIPLIGIYILVSWGIAEFATVYRVRPAVLAVLGSAVVGVLACRAWHQVGYWRDSVTLFSRTLAVTERNYLAHNNLGVALVERGSVDEATRHYRLALAIRPNYAEPYANLGAALLGQSAVDQAIPLLEKALSLAPDLVLCRINLGHAYRQQGSHELALQHYLAALPSSPAVADLHNDIGGVYAEREEWPLAESHFQAALRARPRYPEALFNLARVLRAQKQDLRAAEYYRHALLARPGWVNALYELAWMLSTSADPEVFDPATGLKLAEELHRRVGPSNAAVLDVYAAAQAAAGNFTEAIVLAEQALKLAEQSGETARAEALSRRVALYRSGKPCRGEDARN